jgi:hypothetical protein
MRWDGPRQTQAHTPIRAMGLESLSPKRVIDPPRGEPFRRVNTRLSEEDGHQWRRDVESGSRGRGGGRGRARGRSRGSRGRTAK